MLIVGFELISGFMVGVEWVDLEEIYYNQKGWSFVMDLGIFRIVLEKRNEV